MFFKRSSFILRIADTDYLLASEKPALQPSQRAGDEPKQMPRGIFAI
jgi:hypothetical protein